VSLVSCAVPSLSLGLPEKFLSSQAANGQKVGSVSCHPLVSHLPTCPVLARSAGTGGCWLLWVPELIIMIPFSNSAQRWMGTLRCAARGCSLAGGSGRRSYLFLSPSPHLLMHCPSLLARCVSAPLYRFPNSGCTRNHHTIRRHDTNPSDNISFL
jgi:hypothetical protein